MKRDADAERIRVESQIQTGTHVPDNASRTVLQGCQSWLDHIDMLVRAGKRSQVTWEKYRSHIDHHVAPRPVAGVLLSRLRPSDVSDFAEDLERALSPAMATKVMSTLRMGLRYCRQHQWLATDPAEGVRIARDRSADEDRVEIPPKEDLRALLQTADAADDGGRSRAMVCLMLYCGLRMGELRALTRGALTLTGSHAQLAVTQAADQHQRIKPPKTRAGRRTIPLGPDTVTALRTWLATAPANELHLVFCNGAGHVESHTNLYHRWWVPLLQAAGLTDPDHRGRPVPRFTPHTLRHAAASLWIEMGLQPKRVQRFMGHASLTMTMDLYGHLWTDPAQDSQIARQMERQLR